MSISTATDNTGGVGKQVWDYTEKILAGLLPDLARIQDGELPRDPAVFARSLERALLAAAPGG